MADLASPGRSLDKAETTLVIGCDSKLCGDWIFHMIYGWACIVAFYGNKQQYVDFKDGNYVVAREINNPFKYMLSVICCQF